MGARGVHRSAFRTKKYPAKISQAEKPLSSPSKSADEFKEIREQIANIASNLSPLKANVERLAAPKEDISVPSDIAQSLGRVHNRLDRLERQQQEQDAQLRKMASTFSSALLKLGDKVEKIAGVEDSSFSLAHSLEKLLAVLSSRRLKIIRDRDGDMSAVEIVSPTQN